MKTLTRTLLKKAGLKKPVKKKKPRPPKTMIGWREWCALPLLGLSAVKVKVDTGARTSALHAEDIEFFTRRGKDYVRFTVLGGKRARSCEAPLLQRRIIVSSNGEREMRAVIVTDIVIGGSEFTTELTLTSRHRMRFPMLLGRKALRAGRLTVDPARAYLLGRDPPES